MAKPTDIELYPVYMQEDADNATPEIHSEGSLPTAEFIEDPLQLASLALHRLETSKSPALVESNGSSDIDVEVHESGGLILPIGYTKADLDKVSKKEKVQSDDPLLAAGTSDSSAIKRLGEPRVLTQDEVTELFKRYEKGDLEAKEKLVLHNIRMVIDLAFKRPGSPILTMDLIQEGVTGLIRAIEKFDYRKGYTISTYANIWIRQAFQQAEKIKANMIRIPNKKVEKMQKLERLEREYVQSHNGEKPSLAYLAEVSGLSEDDIVYTRIMKSVTSLDTPVNAGDPESISLGHLIASPDKSVEESVESDYSRAQLNEAIDNLPNEEMRRAIRLHFGIEDGKEHSYTSIARILGINRYRTPGIREVIETGLEALRNNLDSELF